MDEQKDSVTPVPLYLEEGKDIATVCYALMLFGVVFTPLVFVAVVLCYLKRSKVKGHWLYSHYAWQIKTIWVTLCVSAIAFSVFGIALVSAISARSDGGVSESILPAVLGVAFFLMMAAVFVWYVYRSGMGWYRLHKGRPPY